MSCVASNMLLLLPPLLSLLAAAAAGPQRPPNAKTIVVYGLRPYARQLTRLSI
jgi:hypothetical protein